MQANNKFIVVSGGSKGIGREIIRRFAQAGFDALTCARKAPALEALQAEIESNYSVKLYYKTCDLSNVSESKQFARYAQEMNRVPDVLVNNAGIFLPGPMLEEEEGNLENMMHVNLYSAYYLSRALIPLMKSRKYGHVFNIGSIASILPYPHGSSYSISKYALHGLSQVLREELKTHGVKVTSVLPGATFTASWEGAGIDPQRLMKAEDVAETIFQAYQLSPQSVVEEILIRPQLGDL